MRLQFQQSLNQTSLVLIFSTWLFCSGCLQTVSQPEPQLTPAEKAAREAVVSYAQRLAASFEETESQLHSGGLTSAAEVNQRLQAANAAARKQAFQTLDELLNDELGGDQWDALRAQQLFQQISTGLRSFR